MSTTPTLLPPLPSSRTTLFSILLGDLLDFVWKIDTVYLKCLELSICQTLHSYECFVEAAHDWKDYSNISEKEYALREAFLEFFSNLICSKFFLSNEIKIKREDLLEGTLLIQRISHYRKVMHKLEIYTTKISEYRKEFYCLYDKLNLQVSCHFCLDKVQSVFVSRDYLKLLRTPNSC